MRTKLIFLFLLAISFRGFSQTKNAIYFQYGTSTDKLVQSGEVYTSASSGNRGVNNGLGGGMIGIKYWYDISRWFSISSGLSYSKDRFHFNDVLPGHDYETIKLLSIPVTLNVNFLKYLFIDGGITADFQIDKTSLAPEQTGAGLEVGAGAKYHFGPIGIFVNPYYQQRSGSAKLESKGFKFGAGYCF